MKEGRLGYNSYNKRYGLLSSDLWIDTGFHCGECLEVLLDDEWVQTRMEMNPAREWYLVGTPYCGDLEYIRARIPFDKSNKTAVSGEYFFLYYSWQRYKFMCHVWHWF